jgi:DNA-directed RNA polymerase subunit RPC12/RpoP
MISMPEDVLPADSPPPEHKAPTLTKAPPVGRKFPCGKCGARLDFDPSERALKCPYCGHFEEIKPDKAGVQERDYEEYLNKLAGHRTKLEGRSSQVRCTGCGAVVLLEDQVATDKCPFCGTHLENEPEEAQDMIPPESLLPFRVDIRKARDEFANWIKSRWFAPSALKKMANLGQLSGIYVPYWTYDAMTYTHYTGQRGIDYTDTETYYETDAQGNQQARTRTVIRTMWYPCSGEVQHFFDDVLVCGSNSLPGSLIQSLEPWDLKRLVTYKAEYLSGFKTERYAVDLKEGFARAREVMQNQIRRLCEQDIGGNHQIVNSMQSQYVGVTFKHILLPVWLASYRYYDKVYRVMVNARTGQVVGERPWSWIKISALVLLIVAILGVILFFASRH